MNIAPKTAAAAGAGSASIAVVEVMAWILGYWNVVIPPGVGASLATLFAVGASYLAPRQHLPGDPIPGVIAVPVPLQPQPAYADPTTPL